MTVARRENARFLTLDAMRGVAALLVLIHHFPDPTLPRIFQGSYLAVDMFFVLSGFVLSHAYGWDLASRTGGPAFLLKRVIRLYPLYILGSALGLLGYLAIWATWHAWGTVPDLFTSLVAALFFLPLPPRLSFNNVFIFPFNQPAWSLFFELAANFLFALFTWTVPRLLAVIAAGAALLVLAAWTYGNLDIGWRWGDLPSGGARVLYSFFIGVLLYRFQPEWNWRIPAPLLVLVLPLAFMLPASCDLAVVLAGFPLLVFAGSMTEPGPRLERLFKLLGDISYPVYVLHYGVFLFMMWAWYMTTGLELKAAGIMGTLAAILITSIAGYYAGTRLDPSARKWMTKATARLGRNTARA